MNLIDHAILVGEHDKGTGIAFHPDTHSGRVLRQMLIEVGISDIKMMNAFHSDGTPRDALWVETCGFNVIALGKVAYKACQNKDIPSTYLPHPACRTKKHKELLKQGLMNLKESGVL